MFFLAVLLTGCGLNLVKKAQAPEIKKEPVVNNVATSSEKIATTTEGKIASSTDDMSKWKTYSNKIIGIEFKYPPTWPILTKDNVGDNEEDKIKFGISFILGLADLSSVNHMGSRYENLPVSEQYNKVKCPIISGNKLKIKCENRVSDYSVKYSWEVLRDPQFGDSYGAIVEAGKYILTFNFADANNYNKRANEYQTLLSSLKIPE